MWLELTLAEHPNQKACGPTGGGWKTSHPEGLIVNLYFGTGGIVKFVRYGNLTVLYSTEEIGTLKWHYVKETPNEIRRMMFIKS
jgi:hypothetical protein